jgi:hypothetical protein
MSFDPNKALRNAPTRYPISFPEGATKEEKIARILAFAEQKAIATALTMAKSYREIRMAILNTPGINPEEVIAAAGESWATMAFSTKVIKGALNATERQITGNPDASVIEDEVVEAQIVVSE